MFRGVVIVGGVSFWFFIAAAAVVVAVSISSVLCWYVSRSVLTCSGFEP